MTHQANDPALDFALRGIVFPPQPHLIAPIMAEMSKAEPDLKAIALLISGDVTLASSLLKMVNSPFYGLSRKVTSVEEAIVMVGIRKTLHMVRALSLSRSFKPMPGMEGFWEDTARNATFALMLAGELGLDGDISFLMGLFHDSGILLLMQQQSDYLQVFRQSIESSDFSLAELEYQRYNTDHARVGSVFARYWYLPENIVRAIENHHSPDAFTAFTDREIGNLIAIAVLAEDVNAEFLCQPNFNWARMGQAALSHLLVEASAWPPLRADTVARFSEEL